MQFEGMTKDGSTHWFHYPIEKIFTIDKKGKWIERTKQLYEIYEDEIKANKKKSTKSTKLSKSKELKNKSTKVNVIVSNSDIEDDKPIVSKGQNVLKYKSKVKSNSKYISDSEDDLDEFEDNK